MFDDGDQDDLFDSDVADNRALIEGNTHDQTDDVDEEMGKALARELEKLVVEVRELTA